MNGEGGVIRTVCWKETVDPYVQESKSGAWRLSSMKEGPSCTVVHGERPQERLCCLKPILNRIDIKTVTTQCPFPLPKNCTSPSSEGVKEVSKHGKRGGAAERSRIMSKAAQLAHATKLGPKITMLHSN